jgi:large subunit ribosomal protein L19
MADKVKQFNQKQVKNITANINSGDTVRVHQILRPSSKDQKEKIQFFEGIVLAHKHGLEPGGTITVRKVVGGIGVEKIFPLHSPVVKQIEVIKKGRTRRAKLYYLRQAKGKRARLRTETADEKMLEEPIYENKKQEEEQKQKEKATAAKMQREGEVVTEKEAKTEEEIE